MIMITIHLTICYGNCCSLTCVRKLWLEESQFNFRLLFVSYYLNVTAQSSEKYMNRALHTLFSGKIPNTRSKKRLNIKYMPLGVQRMLVKNVINHNALHFELLNAMH